MLPKAEQLLELIDHDQQIGFRLKHLGLLHRFDQAEAASAERGQQTRQRVRIVRIVVIRIDEGPGQILDGTAAGTEDDDFPGRARLGHRAAVKLGNHSGPYQR